MKKKILIFIMLTILLLPLASCSLLYPDLYESSSSSSELTEPNPDNIESEIPITQLQNQYTDVVSKVYNSCVGVLSVFGDSSGTGSGVVYKHENGYFYVVTNNHVVYDFDSNSEGKIKIYVESRISSDSNANANTPGAYYSAEIMGRDEAHDLAVVRFQTDLIGGGNNIVPIDIFNDELTMDTLTAGQSVIAIGCPGGFDEYNYVTEGIISKVSNGYVGISAPINPGNSGGGLFNLAGRLIGLNFQKRTSFQESDGSTISSEGLGEAIGIQHLIKQIPLLEAGNKYGSKPLMGISVGVIIRNLTEDQALLDILPDNQNQVVYVSDFARDPSTGEILPGYSAYSAGLKVNDIIYAAGDTRVYDIDDLSNFLLEKHYGDSITLKLIRDGEFKDLTFVLTEPTE